MAKSPRWGHLSDIDMRTTVGSAAWKANHTRPLQHLSAYRRLHQLTSHDEARELVDAPVSEKLAAIKKLEGK